MSKRNHGPKNRKHSKFSDKRKFSLPDDLVTHPRYGTGPNYTRMESDDAKSFTSWKYCRERVIPHTGIKANTKHHCSAIPVLTYFDVLKKCVDCERHFLFYAREQQHWYEELGFAIDADCIRCVECRKIRQADEWAHANYQRLLEKEEKTWEDYCEIARAALDLYRQGRFKSLDKVRGFLNRIPESQRHRARVQEVTAKLNEAVAEAREAR